MNFAKIKNIIEYAGDISRLSTFGAVGLPHITPAPKSLKIVMTGKCNANCIMCSYWRNNASEELSTGELRDIITQASGSGVKSITFYGGEPLIRPDIFELITHTMSIGLKATIITNGFLLDENRAERLIKSGISHVTISIHGGEAVHDMVMGKKGAYMKAVGGARLIKKYWQMHRSGEGLELLINALIMKPTLDFKNISEVLDVCREVGAVFGVNILDPNIPYFGVEGVEKLWLDNGDIVQAEKLFKKLLEIGEKTPNLIEFDDTLVRLILEYFRNPKSNNIPCIHGFLGPVFVNSNGDIHTCSVLKPMGNIRKDSLKDLVFSKEWQKKAEDMYRLKCPKCICGFAFRTQYHLPTYWPELFSKLIRLNFSRYK